MPRDRSHSYIQPVPRRMPLRLLLLSILSILVLTVSLWPKASPPRLAKYTVNAVQDVNAWRKSVVGARRGSSGKNLAEVRVESVEEERKEAEGEGEVRGEEDVAAEVEKIEER